MIPVYFDDIENAAKDRQRIAEIRDGIRTKFSEFFNAKGYQRHAPGNLVPENDTSVLFTGSTISTFKPYLSDGSIPDGGLYMIQSCLRTQNTRILDNDQKPQWTSYFSSTGALTPYEKVDVLSEQAWQFFTDYLGIPSDRVKIRIASKDIDLLNHWKAASLDHVLEYDVNDPVYYTHKFGMDNVAGRNCNMAIVDHKTGALRDIGNIIVIETPDKKLGAEIAFGVETIVSRILGLSNPIEASLIADIVPRKNEYSLKLADCISSSLVILDTGERPVATNRGRVLRKYMQGVSDLRHKADVSIDEIQKYAADFEVREFGVQSDLPSKIAEYVTKFEEAQAKGFKPEKVNAEASAVFPLGAGQRQSRVSLSSRFEPA